jgi:hypothetical protein
MAKFGFPACSGAFHYNTIYRNAFRHLLPKGDQQLSRDRDDRRLSNATAIAHTFMEPTCKRSIWLMT